MTEISLPYGQVCEIIAETAAQYEKKLLEQKTYEEMYCHEALLVVFGHTLWRALEEAHLAKQGEKK